MNLLVVMASKLLDALPQRRVGGGYHLPSDCTSRAGHLGVSQTESMSIQVGWHRQETEDVGNSQADA
jgi:hypothetical protein